MILDKKDKFNIKYVASSDIICTDGEYTSRIDSDGYIKIENLKNNNYLIFIDGDGDIVLVIYKYIIETKYKEVIDNLNMIRDKTGMHKHPNSSPKYRNINIELSDTLIDITDFQCDSCGGKMTLEDKQNYKIARCAKCNIKYALRPSKYYNIAARTKIF